MARQNSLLLALVVLGAAACGGAGGSDAYGTGPTGSNNPPVQNPPSNTPNTVVVGESAFNPNAVTVSPGTTVTWKWAACTSTGSGDGYGGYGSSSCPTHSVTFDDGSNIASPTQDAGEFARSFASPGTYSYHCAIHGMAMSGQIVVK